MFKFSFSKMFCKEMRQKQVYSNSFFSLHYIFILPYILFSTKFFFCDNVTIRVLIFSDAFYKNYKYKTFRAFENDKYKNECITRDIDVTKIYNSINTENFYISSTFIKLTNDFKQIRNKLIYLS